MTQATTYTAKYVKITKAVLTKLPKQQYKIKEQLDVSGGMLELTTEQGDIKQIPLNSTMVSGFDNEKSGKQTIHVTYQGTTVDYDIEFKAAENKKKSELTKQIEALLKTINPDEPFSDTNKKEIIAMKEKMDQQGVADFNIVSYRTFDKCIQKAYGASLRTIVSDDDSGISVSGLSVAVPLDKPGFFPQSISLSFRKGIDNEAERLLEKLAIGNGYTMDYCFHMNVKHGATPITPQEKLIYALPIINDSNMNRHYTVLAYEGNEVIQIPAEQASNQIRFLTDHVGDFALVYRNSSLTYDKDKIKENNSVETNPHSFWDYLIWIITALILIICIIITFIFRSKRKKTSSQSKPKRTKKKRIKKTKKAKAEQPQPIKEETAQPTEEEEELIHYFRN